MNDNQIGLRDWMRRMEADMERLDEKWQKSVDDIKATIRSEVSELKGEQIAELKQQLRATNDRIDHANLNLSDVKTRQERWDTSAGVINWMIRITFAALGALGGIFGYEGFGRH